MDSSDGLGIFTLPMVLKTLRLALTSESIRGFVNQTHQAFWQQLLWHEVQEESANLNLLFKHRFVRE